MMTREEAMCYLYNPEDEDCYSAKAVEAYNMSTKALELLDKLDEIITKQIDISNNQVECQTLRWVLDVMSEMNVETSQGWIPVSENPKEMGSYITTVDYGEYGLSVGQRFYYGEDHGWDDEHVIAWIPLPKPYEPQESEEV